VLNDRFTHGLGILAGDRPCEGNDREETDGHSVCRVGGYDAVLNLIQLSGMHVREVFAFKSDVIMAYIAVNVLWYAHSVFCSFHYAVSGNVRTTRGARQCDSV